MITLPLGFIAIIGVIFYTFKGVDATALLNSHSIVVVVVGTIAILMASTPLKPIWGMMKAVKELKNKQSSNKYIRDSLQLVIENKNVRLKQEAHQLITFIQHLWSLGIDSGLVEILLTQKLDDLNSRTEKPVTTLRNLAKYPPSLGMTGTVVGMIALFSSLSPENKHNIGPSLALAMSATFYGLALANFVILPLADRLHVKHLNQVKSNEMVYKALIYINRNEPLAVVENVYKDAPFEETQAA